MNWKKYNELDNHQKFMISRMYTNNDPENYLYQYDEKGNFRGRTPTTSETEVKENKPENKWYADDEVKQEIKQRVKRTKKK